MKILITTDWYAPTINGVVTSVLNLQRELTKRGHEVRILTLSQSLHSFESNNVTYIGSIGAGKIYPGARIKTAFFSSYVQDLVLWKPDVIHSQCEFSTFMIARRIAKTHDIPLIHTYHTVYEDYTHYFSPSAKWGRNMVTYLSRWIIKQCSCVIAPTQKVQTILNNYGIKKNIHVIPTGIDLGRFQAAPAAESQLALKKQLGIPAKNKILLYVGRLAKEKNLEELLRYHANLNAENLTFLIVGDGPQRSELQRIVLDLGIQDSVKFTGMIPPEHIGDYYHLSDLFVSASGSETQGLTYIEALASGLPALCRKDECLDGVVLNGYNGWQYNNEHDYVKYLDTFFTNEEIQGEFQENAAQFAHKTFSSEMFAEKVESVYLKAFEESEAYKLACSKRLAEA